MLLLKASIIAAQAQLVFFSAATFAAEVTKSSKPTVYFIRHGEKPVDGDGLSADGLQRAECLRNVFGKNSSFSINHIIAQRPQLGVLEPQPSEGYRPLTSLDGRQKRPYDTVLPLSRDLGLEVDTHCERDDVHCVEKTTRSYSGPGNILICWEHSTMSNITEIMGDKNPPHFPRSEFVLHLNWYCLI
jgi:hypothetical protein